MRAEVPLERGMAREAGLEPAGSVLETDSVATSLIPPYFNYRISKTNKNPRTGRGSVSTTRDTDPYDVIHPIRFSRISLTTLLVISLILFSP